MPRNAVAVMTGIANVGRPGACHIAARGEIKQAAVIHGCPCGCGGVSSFYLEGGGNGRPEHRVTEGVWPKVTVSPSIGIKYDVGGMPGRDGGYHWHGYLRDGVFVEE